MAAMIGAVGRAPAVDPLGPSSRGTGGRVHWRGGSRSESHEPERSRTAVTVSKLSSSVMVAMARTLAPGSRRADRAG